MALTDVTPGRIGSSVNSTGIRSAMIENCVPATLGLPAVSCAAPAGMSTVTEPETAGVTVAA